MSRSKQILLWVQVIFYVLAGTNHLMNPAFYEAIVPPDLPSPEWLNVISGLAEIVLGVFLIDRRTRPFAAWGIIALLVAVFPANLWVALESVGLPRGVPGTGSATFNWIRLPLQVLFVAWAWWYTRESAPTSGAGDHSRRKP